MIERDEGYDIKILLQVITKSESQEKEKKTKKWSRLRQVIPNEYEKTTTNIVPHGACTGDGALGAKGFLQNQYAFGVGGNGFIKDGGDE